MNKNLLIFIVIAALILWVVYYYSQQNLTDQLLDETNSISSDTSVSVIEGELQNTEIDNLDHEFADIDAELEAALSSAK